MQWLILSVSVLTIMLACSQLVHAHASKPTPELTVAESGEVHVRPARRPKRSIIPLVVGVGVFASGYAISVLYAFEMLIAEPHMLCSSCHFARRLWVPVVGPWLLYPHAERGTEKGLIVAMGALQALGLAVAVWGAVKFVESGSSPPSRAQAETTSDRLTFSFTPLRVGGYGSLSLHW
jgi:hypothetical protein